MPEARQPGEYDGFKVLLDDPSPDPGLGFGEYSDALAGMILHSRADFAVGVFGGWGSGKTTLLRTVQKRLMADDSVVTVWFNAWRYERDPHPIVPLLDVLREALLARDRARTAPWARDAAVMVGRASRALLAGVKLSVDAVPGFKIDFEPDKVIEKFSKARGQGPQSFYHVGFSLLRQAIAGISGKGARRVVIFVDDLDRCSSGRALQMMESMKLLFGVEGCVFVVALDEQVVREAIAGKYGTNVSATKYVQKIFQVPFNLPRTSITELGGYLDAIERTAGFGDAQLRDFRVHVRPHLAYLADEGAINLREIKLLINSYVLELRVLSPRLGAGLDPDIVLALLCLNYREDWRPCHDQLTAEPQVVQPALAKAVRSPGGQVWLPGATEPVPLSLLRYLEASALPLVQVADLRPYLTAAESTWSADPWIPQARVLAIQLRRSSEAALLIAPPRETIERLLRTAQDLRDLIVEQKEPPGIQGGIHRDLVEAVALVVAELAERAERAEWVSSPGPGDELLQARFTAMFDRLDAGLRDYQRYSAR